MRYVLGFHEIEHTHVELVGGKAAHLAALTRVRGVTVPRGFCITTSAFQRTLRAAPALSASVEKLLHLALDDHESYQRQCAAIRRSLVEVALPNDIVAAVTDAVAQLGNDVSCAVRSSATAEDAPDASFAGQHDSYLNVIGASAILAHVKRCWSSLFSERAASYRLAQRTAHHDVQMAVAVQQLIVPQASGVLFTADPITGHRKVSVVEASYGLGEAVVSGLVRPDVFTVRDDKVASTTIGTKRLAIRAAAGGGTAHDSIAPARQREPALSAEQVVHLARIGRHIEAQFGAPQDIEWCLDDNHLFIVQSRPITTLFPLPATDDDGPHVYISVGHQQMMTDAMPPLGLSMWQLIAARPMSEAGGRLFVDVTSALASPAGRAGLLGMAGRSDPLIGDALNTVMSRVGYIPEMPDAGANRFAIPGATDTAPIDTDPTIVERLIARSRASIDATQREIRELSGNALLDYIEANVRELKRMLFDPASLQVIMASVGAVWWLNEHLEEWLGERGAADALAASVDDNITSEMGLALLDVADVIRPHARVVTFLAHSREDAFLDALPSLAGGTASRDAIRAWLDRYGQRGIGEIDITRPRWRERPAMLLPVLLSNIRNFASGERARRFAKGQQTARAAEQDLVVRLTSLPDGTSKVEETRRQITRLRAFAGYREYPKYAMVSHTFLYRRSLLQEADRLVRDGVLETPDDMYFLRFEELQEVVRTRRVDKALVARRRGQFRRYQSLRPPRVFTSDGEVITGVYHRDGVPSGALMGLPVSAGISEGRARVVLDVAQAHFEPGDILVTTYTDPSWTPLFVAVSGLVTEVGGVMTHGAVIAREYGLPAVVGVDSATRLIRDGQQIRVHGTEGYVEILSA